MKTLLHALHVTSFLCSLLLQRGAYICTCILHVCQPHITTASVLNDYKGMKKPFKEFLLIGLHVCVCKCVCVRVFVIV